MCVLPHNRRSAYRKRYDSELTRLKMGREMKCFRSISTASIQYYNKKLAKCKRAQIQFEYLSASYSYPIHCCLRQHQAKWEGVWRLNPRHSQSISFLPGLMKALQCVLHNHSAIVGKNLRGWVLICKRSITSKQFILMVNSERNRQRISIFISAVETYPAASGLNSKTELE